MKIHTLAGRGYASNCYLVESGGHALLIDPSLSPSEARGCVEGNFPKVDLILLTHAHFDHMLYLDEWRKETGAPLAMHELEACALADPDKTAFSLFLGRNDVFAPPERLLRDGSIIAVGEETLRVMSTPGHTVGSICLFGEGCVFTGDTVFTEGSYGRTDLWSGDTAALIASIRALTECSHEGRMYPGHGPSGDFRREMRYFIG